MKSTIDLIGLFIGIIILVLLARAIWLTCRRYRFNVLSLWNRDQWRFIKRRRNLFNYVRGFGALDWFELTVLGFVFFVYRA